MFGSSNQVRVRSSAPGAPDARTSESSDQTADALAGVEIREALREEMRSFKRRKGRSMSQYETSAAATACTSLNGNELDQALLSPLAARNSCCQM